MTTIKNIEELEDHLSRPTEADAAAMSALNGDLLILGAGGKMGPSLARLARRAAALAGAHIRIVAVARFSNASLPAHLAAQGIETISCDLLEPGALSRLPEIPNVIFMAARKFETSGAEHLTWAMNTFLSGLVAERYRKSRIVAFSTGNVYPLRSLSEGGAVESTPVGPVGEYAQSALGRERMFENGSHRWGTRVAILRLNYAVELRYGVLVDIARAVFERRPISLTMPYVNVIWQRDANSWCLRSFAYCQSPPFVLNITGPETLSVREVAMEFGQLFGIEPTFVPEPEGFTSLLNNAAKAGTLFGQPTATPSEMIGWIAEWILQGGVMLNKPTHFQTRDGRF
ncbi:MAG TPA: NAD-dependent epimerase/dehydratase family protein [Candidatus Sulfotelmatobacter sp.]|nr:NAD-dependent epimerase/dehydratase family protein [Candidatus Sulfotelmatobacter sp.]